MTTATVELFAVLIDTENGISETWIDLSIKCLQGWLKQQQWQGVLLKRAYGGLGQGRLKQLEPLLNQHEIAPVSCACTSKGKNSVDIHIVADAMELLLIRRVRNFCIISNDGDFTPLVRKLKEYGAKVFGFGGKSISSVLRNSYHGFRSFEHLEQIYVPQLQPALPPAASSVSMALSVQTVEAEVVTISSKQPSTRGKAATPADHSYAKVLREMTLAGYREVNPGPKGMTVKALVTCLQKQCQKKLGQPFSCKLFGYSSIPKLLEGTELFDFVADSAKNTPIMNQYLRLKPGI